MSIAFRCVCICSLLIVCDLSKCWAQQSPSDQLEKWLAEKPAAISMAAQQSFATLPLDQKESERATVLLWNYFADQRRTAMREKIKSRTITEGELSLRWLEKRFGTAPPTGHALFISMHGGGNAPAAVNDRQWKNQINLYEPAEGIVVAPRAPTNTWNLWHESHIDGMFDELILAYQIAEGIDPRRVYLMGYSAGGDGVYQLAPRMADRFAAACMMAGHPNETQPQGLRNLPFAIFMGGKDAAYKRNEVALQWSEKLAELRRSDPNGYEHLVKIYPEKGHWMDKQDAEGIPWMSQFRRQEFPKRIVWRQDDVLHQSFYWISLTSESAKPGTELVVQVKEQTLELKGEPTGTLKLWLHDQLVDLDQPLTFKWHAGSIQKSISRTIAQIAESLTRFRDPTRACPASIELAFP